MVRTCVKVFVVVAALALGPSAAVAGGLGSAPPVLWGALPPGTFAVGFRVIHAYDAARTWTSEEVLGDRRAAGSSGRPIRIAVWYPARPNPRARRLAFGGYMRLSAD